jgi:hypothetical protein
LVQRAPKPAQAIRLNAELGTDATITRATSFRYGAAAIISPDGKRLALIGQASDK